MPFIEFGTKEYTRTFLSMLIGSIVTFAILYFPQSLITVFSDEFSISPSTASFSLSFATIALACSMLIISVISNAWGRKKMMGASLLIASILTIAASFSPNFETLIILRVLQGIAISGFPAVAMTYLSEEISPRHYGRILGIYIAGSAFGGFLGRLIASIFTDFFSWHMASLILGILSLAGSLLFLMYLPESKHFSKTALSVQSWAAGMISGLKDRKLLYLYGLGFLFMGVYVSLFNYIGFPLSSPPFLLSHTMIGLLFIFQLTGSWSSVFFGKLTERFSRSALISCSIVLLVIGGLLTLSEQIAVLMLGLILFASGFFAGHTVASSWVGVMSPPKIRTYTSSLYLLFYYTGSSFIGWLGGLFLSSFGWDGVIWMICGFLVFSSILVLKLSWPLSIFKIQKTTHKTH
ncbi:YNFM family putative membrane transporter [Bacillus oleivorans]|uniref:YNFM family putative membrane transporter n=1 Tax=Bacillus oleivorans TaxID=1448271 RepID=A0A285D706_9BACI|nr:MFS transporter [Bacillus oleivorans]SNX75600.1 YNFM family putative membrane transporter [Bacillus oleivorans]